MWPRVSSVPDDAEKRHPPVPFPVPCTLYHSSVCPVNSYHHILMKYTSRLHTRSLLSMWWQRALEIATSSSQLKCRVDFKAHGYGPRFLPRPELFPIQGCFEDPAAYLCEDGHNCRASGRHYNSSTRWLNGDGPNPPWHKGPAYTEPSPFGTLPGLETDVGIINLPETLFGWKYDSGTGRNTKWIMTSEVKFPMPSPKSRCLDPNPRCGPPSIPGVQKTDESKSASTSDAIDDLQSLIKCEKQTPSSMVSKSAKLSPTTWCSAPPPSAPPMFERRFPKLERRRRLSS